MNRQGGAFGLALVVALTAGAGVWGWSQTQDHFPHLTHQRLFPTCEGCHQVEPAGVTFPSPDFCAQCHNGEIVDKINWTGPAHPPSNLKFNHSQVLAAKKAALGVDFPCSGCHVPQGAQRMDVKRAVVSGCMQCHAPNEEHYVGAPCKTCHIPIWQAKAFSVTELETFPIPSDHADDFLLKHGALAQKNVERCSVCHARQLCSSCHVNAPSVPQIQALQPDPRVAEIAAGLKITYPVPSSHQKRGWLEKHGGTARAGTATCAVCHTRDSCETCHVEPAPAPVQHLPPAPKPKKEGGGQERGPGVQLQRRPPSSHVPTWLETHRSRAAGATAECQVCHTRGQCVSCHTGSEALARPGRDAARYHPANWMQKHSTAAFNRDVECASCHNTEAFCRSCHVTQGLGSKGRIDTGFHDQNPAWIFGHGKAARQGLESCASCHAQRDCLECHSALGGRRFNPHGPGFDPERLKSKNPGLCLTCHRPSILDQ